MKKIQVSIIDSGILPAKFDAESHSVDIIDGALTVHNDRYPGTIIFALGPTIPYILLTVEESE